MDKMLNFMEKFVANAKVEELEKIKAEIDDIEEPDHDFEGFYYCFNEVMKVLDKYIKENKQGVLEQIAEKQKTLSDSTKAWSDYIDKHGDIY